MFSLNHVFGRGVNYCSRNVCLHHLNTVSVHKNDLLTFEVTVMGGEQLQVRPGRH